MWIEVYSTMLLRKMTNKVRNLLEDPTKDKICLNDLIMELAAMSGDVATLEYSVSNKKALNRLKKALIEFEKNVIAYKRRIKDEVTPEIVAYIDGLPKAKPRGRIENILEYNEKRRNQKNK